MSTNQPQNGNAISKESDAQQEAQVSQIRDLLFGQQMTEYEDRFALLEEKLTDRINTLRASMEQHLVELHQLMKSRADDVESASVPRSQIADSLEKLARSLRG